MDQHGDVAGGFQNLPAEKGARALGQFHGSRDFDDAFDLRWSPVVNRLRKLLSGSIQLGLLLLAADSARVWAQQPPPQVPPGLPMAASGAPWPTVAIAPLAPAPAAVGFAPQSPMPVSRPPIARPMPTPTVAAPPYVAGQQFAPPLLLPAAPPPVPPPAVATYPPPMSPGAAAHASYLQPAPGGNPDLGGPGAPILDPNQPGNLGNIIDPGAAPDNSSRMGSPVLDPNQAGNLNLRMDSVERGLKGTDGGKRDELPLIRLSGFMQLDEGLFSQSAASIDRLGNIQNGVGFRRTRLQAIGKLTQFTGYTIEMDFATVGRPSFMDVWGEQSELPFFGTVRIGHFRQPGTMDGWTSVRHLEFLERSLPFQALDPFRRVGVMAYAMSEDERTTWAYSVYATGLTFFNGTDTVYSTLGDTRGGTEIGDSGGVAFASRATHLLYYDEPAEGRYLLHIGGGYHFAQLGGKGTTGPFARTDNMRPIPEFFVGDPNGGGLTAAGTPVVADSGRILANSFNFFHTELAGNYGAAHFQTEFMATSLNQRGGPAVFYPGAYFQAGYFLTGESCLYLKQAGVLDYNVVPYSDFFGTGRRRGFGGFGAWEVAFRWSWVDMTGADVLPSNQLSKSDGPPPAPNPGVVNQTTLAVNWWWNRFTRLQFNWIRSMPNYSGAGPAPFDIFGGRFQIEF